MYAIGTILVVFIVWRLLKLSTGAVGEAIADVERRWNADHNLVETASWFGQTGLADAEERELSRYLRREFGEVGTDDGLRAADLDYLGLQTDDRGPAHFWKILRRAGQDEWTYAYIDVDADGRAASYGWGDREPGRAQP